MAEGFNFTLDYSEVARRLEAAVGGARRGSVRAIVRAAKKIEQKTSEQVPERTGTLASSYYSEIEEVAGDVLVNLGYGGNGDPVNPITGQHASAYMLAVHEDLNAPHPGGKAKFLEDPVNEVAQEFLGETAEIMNEELK